MANWTTPAQSREEVDWAGGVIASRRVLPDGTRVSLNEWMHAFEIARNWKASHNFPLNTFQLTLRRKAKKIPHGDALVAQRIKRISSIVAKLRRFNWITLSSMQDIGGCRAVMSSTKAAEQLVAAYINSDLKHEVVDRDDYVLDPKSSGYRGYHLIYAYKSDKNAVYDGLKVELQVRSLLQHSWATAVEIVGAFTRQALKSSQGEAKWRRFFALMSTEIAHRERKPLVPKTPTIQREWRVELRELADELDVIHRLNQYSAAMNVSDYVSVPDAHFFLLRLNTDEKQLTVEGFRLNQIAAANERLTAVEEEIANVPGADAVLVSVDSINALRTAYPNYYADSSVFVEAVRRAVQVPKATTATSSRASA